MAVYKTEAPPTTDDAQSVITGHAVALNGMCVRCGTTGPCHLRIMAEQRLAQEGLLPRRVAHATRPQTLNVGRWYGWSKKVIPNSVATGEGRQIRAAQ